MIGNIIIHGLGDDVLLMSLVSISLRVGTEIKVIVYSYF